MARLPTEPTEAARVFISQDSGETWQPVVVANFRFVPKDDTAPATLVPLNAVTVTVDVQQFNRRWLQAMGFCIGPGHVGQRLRRHGHGGRLAKIDRRRKQSPDWLALKKGKVWC